MLPWIPIFMVLWSMHCCRFTLLLSWAGRYAENRIQWTKPQNARQQENACSNQQNNANCAGNDIAEIEDRYDRSNAGS
jgi:hypothetical protein